jgi:hypothetical protein
MLLLRRYWFSKTEDPKLLESRLSRGRNTVWWFIEVACCVGSSRFVCRQFLDFCWNDGDIGNQFLCRLSGGSCPLTINYYTCNEKEDTQTLKKNYFIALLSVFAKLGILIFKFFLKSVEKTHVSLKSEKNNSTLLEDLCTVMTKTRWIHV